MISRPSNHDEVLSYGLHGGNEYECRTERDIELWREPNRLVDLNYAIRGHIIQEPLKMEHENRWERLYEHLLARLAEVELHRLQV